MSLHAHPVPKPAVHVRLQGVQCTKSNPAIILFRDTVVGVNSSVSVGTPVRRYILENSLFTDTDACVVSNDDDPLLIAILYYPTFRSLEIHGRTGANKTHACETLM